MAGRFSVEAVFKAVDRMTAPVTRMQNRIGKMTRSMDRGFRRANKTINSFVSSLRSGTAAAAKYGAIGIGTVTAGIGLLVREFSKVEDAEAAFTPLLGGAKRAKEMVDALNATAASTPFQFETLTSATSQLLPVMNGDIENTVKTLRMLGDTAGGNAQKLESITRGFTKAMLKGKVDMESLNMIAEAGVPIFGDLASVMGTEVNASFFKMISAGKVTTTQLTAAFEKMTSSGGKFYKGMEISSRTTSGLWSTLKDNISLTAAELGGAMAPAIKELIKDATGMAQQLREWVKQNRELISVKFSEFIASARTFVGKLIDGISFLIEHGRTIGIVIASVVALSLVLKTLIGIMTLVNLVMMANPLGLIIVGVVALAAAFAALVIWFDEIADWFDSMPSVIKLILGPIYLLIKAIKLIKDNWGTITGALGFGGDEAEAPATAAGGTAAGAQVVSPETLVSRTLEDRRTTSAAEVTIKDETGRAALTGGKLGAGVSLQPTGAF